MPDLEQAQRLLDAGQNVEALRESMALLTVEPRNGSAWRMAATAALRSGSFQDSIDFFQKAVELQPHVAGTWLEFGSALNTIGHHEAALHATTEALRRDINLSAAFYERGLAYAALNQHWWALASFGQAKMMNPKDKSSHEALFKEWKRPPRYPHPQVSARSPESRYAVPSGQRPIHFVSLTRGRKEETALYRSLCKLGITDYTFFEHNTRGMSECYNKLINCFVGENLILACVHDDISIPDVFIQEKLTEASGWFNIIGVAGGSEFRDNGQEVDSWHSATPTVLQVSGSVLNQAPGELAARQKFGPSPAECVTIDGILLAFDMLAIGSLRFDEQFQFHFYDTDMCVEAFHRGITVGTTDLVLVHESHGEFLGDSYKQALNQFRLKWGDPVSISIHTLPQRS